MLHLDLQLRTSKNNVKPAVALGINKCICKMRKIELFIFLFLVVSCETTGSYDPTDPANAILAVSKTGGRNFPLRQKYCEYKVFTAAVTEKYHETGMIEIDAAKEGRSYTFPKNISTFSTLISDSVCELGGTAVIAHANGLGRYIKATVIVLESDLVR